MSFQTEDRRTIAFMGIRLLSLSSFLLAIAVGLISSFTLSAAYDMVLGAFDTKFATVSGVWHGQWVGVHAVTIRLEQRGQTIRGTARFSRVAATSEGPKAMGASEEVPLLNMKLRGDRLTFEVQDSDVSHTSIPVRMEMKFMNEGEAGLRRGQEQDESFVITMLKEHSF